MKPIWIFSSKLLHACHWYFTVFFFPTDSIGTPIRILPCDYCTGVSCHKRTIWNIAMLRKFLASWQNIPSAFFCDPHRRRNLDLDTLQRVLFSDTKQEDSALQYFLSGFCSAIFYKSILCCYTQQDVFLRYSASRFCSTLLCKTILFCNNLQEHSVLC
jgi:hypothetical protein